MTRCDTCGTKMIEHKNNAGQTELYCKKCNCVFSEEKRESYDNRKRK